MLVFLILYIAVGFKVSSWVSFTEDHDFTAMSILFAIVAWPIVLYRHLKKRKKDKI